MTSLKLYGVPLSQPFRSVAWALLQKKVPFEVKLAVPAMKSKVGAQGPEHRGVLPARAVNFSITVATQEKHLAHFYIKSMQHLAQKSEGVHF